MALDKRNLPKGKGFELLREAVALVIAAGFDPEVRPARGSHHLIIWRDTAGTRRVVCVAKASGEWHQRLLIHRNLRNALSGVRP
jgi:hypothetical protein